MSDIHTKLWHTEITHEGAWVGDMAAEASVEIERLAKERDKYREIAGAFIAMHAVRVAADQGAPSDRHVNFGHYDLMAECGCRMDDFVRWEP